MILTFENQGVVGTGLFPDFLQFYDTEGQLFYVKEGELFGKPSEKLNGYFNSPDWLSENKVLNDSNVSLLEIKTLNGFGLIGSFKSNDTQKMIIYEFQFNMDQYLKDGNIQFSVDNPIYSFNLSVENPKDEYSDIDGNVAISENSSLFSPGAKVIFKFSMGEGEEDFEMGTFYIDHSDYSVLSESVQVDGRNLIGKALKDQTLNTHKSISYKTISGIFEELLEYANLTHDQYDVQFDSNQRSFGFTADKDILSAINEILKTMVTWKIEESTDGRIVIGDLSYGLFCSKINLYISKK